MSSKYFLDTNILVYSFSPQFLSKQKKSLALIGEALEDSAGMISYQVVQEFLNVALHKFEKPLCWEESYQYFEEVLGPLCSVYPDPELYRHALRIRHETGYRFYDSLIIASAIEGGCRILYSEDLQDGRKIGELSIKNPF